MSPRLTEPFFFFPQPMSCEPYRACAPSAVLLEASWRENDVTVVAAGKFRSHYVDKNTVLWLNTKFCFTDTLIARNWFRLWVFLFFNSSSRWTIDLLKLFHCVCKQVGWIFSKSIIMSYSSFILCIARRNFSLEENLSRRFLELVRRQRNARFSSLDIDSWDGAVVRLQTEILQLVAVTMILRKRNEFLPHLKTKRNI